MNKLVLKNNLLKHNFTQCENIKSEAYIALILLVCSIVCKYKKNTITLNVNKNN